MVKRATSAPPAALIWVLAQSATRFSSETGSRPSTWLGSAGAWKVEANSMPDTVNDSFGCSAAAMPAGCWEGMEDAQAASASTASPEANRPRMRGFIPYI